MTRVEADFIFHGDERPDAADFRLFSYVNMYGHTYPMRQLLKSRGQNDKFCVWYQHMSRACKTSMKASV
jgi:hypothetical protein